VRVGRACPDQTPAGRAPRSNLPPSVGRSGSDDVFLNIPFDNDHGYEKCFLALVAGTVGLGLSPHSVLEVPSGGADRQRRIFDLLTACRYSLHDLSRVELSGGRYPRFNMPFEAGLASALAFAHSPKHDRYILETNPRRVLRTLSDLNGVDVYGHGGTAIGTLRALTNIFVRPGSGGINHLAKVFKGLVRFANAEIRRPAGREGLFQPSVFSQLVVAAREADRLIRLRPAKNRIR
jgi:hypothetical protein